MKGARRYRDGDRPPFKTPLEPRHWLLIAFLLCAMVLGGSSVAGSTRLLQFISTGVAFAAIVRWKWTGRLQFDPLLGLILVTLAAIFLIQQVPLPPEMWGRLPGRRAIFDDYGLVGMKPPWLPLSLDPIATRQTLTAQLPLLCVVLLCGGLDRFAPRAIGSAVIAGGAISLLLGIAQAQGGQQESLFLHRAVFGSAMGFFANSNHLATLLLICVPIAAVLLREAASRSARLSGMRYPAFAGILCLALAALVLTRSVAGILLLLPTAAASFPLLGAPKRLMLIAAAAGSLLIGGSMIAFDWDKFFSENTSLGTSELDRGGIAARSVTIVKDTFPVGTGLGSFRAIYRLYEDPMAVGPTWVNRAHNEYLELIVEAGLSGAFLVLLMWLWWIVRSLEVWRGEAQSDPWAQAASIIVGIVLLHSLVDYPARMPAIGTILTYFVLLLSARAREGKTAESRDPPKMGDVQPGRRGAPTRPA